MVARGPPKTEVEGSSPLKVEVFIVLASGIFLSYQNRSIDFCANEERVPASFHFAPGAALYLCGK